MTENNQQATTWDWDFNALLLVGLIVIMAAAAVTGFTWFLLANERLEIPEIQPAVQVGRTAQFPVGASRVVHWGERIVLVVRTGEEQFFAVQGTAPSDGCILRWDADAMRIVSPCNHLVYDLRGAVVTGLNMTPLFQYGVVVRNGIVYVTG